MRSDMNLHFLFDSEPLTVAGLNDLHDQYAGFNDIIIEDHHLDEICALAASGALEASSTSIDPLTLIPRTMLGARLERFDEQYRWRLRRAKKVEQTPAYQALLAKVELWKCDGAVRRLLAQGMEHHQRMSRYGSADLANLVTAIRNSESASDLLDTFAQM